MQVVAAGEARGKPAGGFKFIPVWLLYAVWWAYREKHIGPLDLRIWFALLEMQARREASRLDRVPWYDLAELARLVGVTDPVRLRQAWRRLRAAGLGTWDDDGVTIVFPTTPAELSGPEWVDYHAGLERIPNRRRKVPVPRRLVRLLASGIGRARTGTLIGHLTRCLYYRKGACHPQGLAKASWVADRFGVSLRAVKDARRWLADAGVLTLHDTPQWASNRWGLRVSINLDYGDVDADASHKRDAEFAPPPAESCTDLHPLGLNKEPLLRKDSQSIKLTSASAGEAPPVFEDQKDAGKEKSTPERRTVSRDDLADTARLMDMYCAAVRTGQAERSEAGRLQFFALAEHARVKGRNPAALFKYLLRKQEWHFITADDEDAASERLKRWDCLQDAAGRQYQRNRDIGAAIHRQQQADEAGRARIRAQAAELAGTPARVRAIRPFDAPGENEMADTWTRIQELRGVA